VIVGNREIVGETASGPPAPEAWNQSIGAVVVPVFKPLATDASASDSSCRLFECVSSVEIANETESADDFRVVRLRNCITQFLISKMAYYLDSSCSHTNRYVPEGQELALEPSATVALAAPRRLEGQTHRVSQTLRTSPENPTQTRTRSSQRIRSNCSLTHQQCPLQGRSSKFTLSLC
jgi:hypothetical protein